MEKIIEFLLKKEVIVPIIVVIVGFLLCVIAKKIIYRIFNFKILKVKDGKKKSIVNLISNIVVFIIVFICAMIILDTYGVDTASFIASLGIMGLIIGLALQDLLKDFIVGMSIIFEGQFSIGDTVSIGGFKGEVLPSSLRTTKLKAETGEIKIIYNRNIAEVINFSMGHTSLFIDINMPKNTDVEEIKEILANLCSKIKEEYNLDEMNYMEEESNKSMNFRLVGNSTKLEKTHLEKELKKEVISSFKERNITLSANQVVIHFG